MAALMVLVVAQLAVGGGPARATTPSYSLSIVSGDNQSATVGAAFAAPLVVQLYDDTAAAAVPGIQVCFFDPAPAGPSIEVDGCAVTDENGQASYAVTANLIAGSYQIQAEGALGQPVVFNLTNLAGPVTKLRAVSGGDQQTTVFSEFAEPLVVEADDAYDNPVAGVSIAFAVPPQAFSMPELVTDAVGRVSANAFATQYAGTYSVLAFVPFNPAVTRATFNLTNLPGPAFSLTVVSGDRQATTVGTAFPNPLVVVARDQFGNVVPDALVATLSASFVSTDANGQASVTATANEVPGTYPVNVVVVPGGPSATIILTNLARAYTFAGFSQPVNADGSSIFKLGSTVPVKFRLIDGAGAAFPSAAATLSVTKISNGIAGTLMEAVSTAQASSGNAFRYDATAEQYIFNWSTKGLAQGTYRLTVNLDDGTSQSVQVSLK